MLPQPPSVVIENVTPLVDGGRYPIKRVVGEDTTVEADIYKGGHDVVSAVLKWRKAGAVKWSETPMTPILRVHDRWSGTFSVFENAIYEYTIEAWGDFFRTWQHDFAAKFGAGQPDLKSETLEGAGLLENAAALATSAGRKPDAKRLQALAEEIRNAAPEEVNGMLHRPELEALMSAWADRRESCEFILNLPPPRELVEGEPNPIAAVYDRRTSENEAKKSIRSKKKFSAAAEEKSATVTDRRYKAKYPEAIVDRLRAGFAAWYEFFPRSAQGLPDRGSTFRDCLTRVDDAKAMGFDVIYFPPVHPVGITARKGRNNSVTCEPGEPGVPYAIGNRHQDCPNGGGHKDVAPELGTLADFDWLVGEIKKRGMEVALDFAINCAPDHPYVHEHPDWFYKRPDGTIKYAENPPKKYQDVYPMNFHNADWRAMWSELTSVIEFWCEHGVRIFRVDNPHTKPVSFWEYLITRVQSRWPDAIFLSEAFTKPKMMRVLAKAGFTHSYTYFAWRNTKHGLAEYFTELTQSDLAEVMRPNLWPNTPDILPSYLQFGGRPAFIVRAVLAATLSPIYGIYSGFELCENTGMWKADWNPAADVRHFLNLCDWDYKQLAKEEYWESEKYQFKARDWNAPGNIKEIVTRLNNARRENRALQQLRNLRFQHADNDLVLCYSKATVARDSLILVVVNLDAWLTQDSFVSVPLEDFGLAENETYQVHDLLTDARYLWTGRRNFVRLDPQIHPAHVFRIRRKAGSEQNFDVFM
ncbi:MAG TPA: alpha-1,4-glucan--maltose-1-phosphate maltosyltransferase [Chthoniobacteraceae bacterium]|nr:alpha-1,4-glucan--maltose-1-phosphate maltosyltransferase [Chthoniobacteraceae bacterium]